MRISATKKKIHQSTASTLTVFAKRGVELAEQRLHEEPEARGGHQPAAVAVGPPAPGDEPEGGERAADEREHHVQPLDRRLGVERTGLSASASAPAAAIHSAAQNAVRCAAGRESSRALPPGSPCAIPPACPCGAAERLMRRPYPRKQAQRQPRRRTRVRPIRPRLTYTGPGVPTVPDRRLRRARAQPQGRHGGDAARRAGRHHGAFWLWQVVAGVRHDLRRGPASLCRVAERVRAPVPRPDGQARRRLDRGAVAGDLDRPEDDLAQPALDCRHGDRDLRLPAAAVGADRQAALLQLRAADRRAVGRADHRPGHGARGRHAVHGHGADRARPQGRVRQAVRGAAGGGLHARQGRRRGAPARGGHRPRQEVQARHRGRSSTGS